MSVHALRRRISYAHPHLSCTHLPCKNATKTVNYTSHMNPDRLLPFLVMQHPQYSPTTITGNYTATLFYMKTVIKNFVVVQSHATPQYNQSGDRFRLIPSHHQAFPFQELSIKPFTATRSEKYICQSCRQRKISWWYNASRNVWGIWLVLRSLATSRRLA